MAAAGAAVKSLSFLLAGLAVTVLAGAAPAPAAPPLPLSIAVVTANGKTAQTGAWIEERFAEAQRIYNKMGVSFHKPEIRRLDPRFQRLETRSDRDALAGELKPGVINVFIVSSLRDVDDPSLYRMGVHWAPNGNLKKQYVIVAASAGKTTMAHEIGHYFGLQHTDVANNLMSYKRDGPEVFLNAFQTRKVVASVKGYVARKELVPVVE